MVSKLENELSLKWAWSPFSNGKPGCGGIGKAARAKNTFSAGSYILKQGKGTGWSPGNLRGTRIRMERRSHGTTGGNPVCGRLKPCVRQLSFKKSIENLFIHPIIQK
jgi:hypothetical protein